MSEPRIVLSGLTFPESPRWHDGQAVVSDWGAGQVLGVSQEGTATLLAQVRAFPLCVDFLPDGRMLLVAGATLLRLEESGSLVPHADLGTLGEHPWNDIVVTASGDAYVNNIGFDFPGGSFAPGFVALVRPDGQACMVAEDLAFPNGMAISADGATLVVAESYANVLSGYRILSDGTLADRRVWAPTPGDHPDGICFDASGAVWYADVGNQRCVRVAEGGQVLQTVALDWGAFACVLGGADGRTLYVATNVWGDVPADEPAGQLVAIEVEVPRGGGHP